MVEYKKETTVTAETQTSSMGKGSQGLDRRHVEEIVWSDKSKVNLFHRET